MNSKQLKSFLKVCRKANIVPFIWGAQGIGKSQITYQYAKENKLNFIDLRLSLMEPGDLIGMPSIKNGKTHFNKPDWFPNPRTKGVLFLDELPRANEDILQAIFQLVLDRRINGHVLPKGWQIVSAGNYGKQFNCEELDPALKDRFCHIKLDLDYDAWTRWAEQNNISNKIISTIQTEKVLSEKDTFNVSDLGITTSPRSWEMVNSLLGKCDYSIFKEACLGLLSPTHASLFLKTLRLGSVDINKILEGDFSEVSKLLKKDKVGEISALNEKLKDLLEKGLNTKQEKNVLDYAEFLPFEFRVAFLKLISSTLEDIDFEERHKRKLKKIYKDIEKHAKK